MKNYKKELVQIKKLLKANPKGMTLTEISKEININRNSVAKYLDILLTSGGVEMRFVGPAKVFSLSHRVPLSAILNLSSDFILVLDKDLKIVQANDILLDFIKVKRKAMIGKEIKNCPYLSTNSKVMSNVKKAFEGKDSTTEASFKKAKKKLYFKIKMIPTTFDDGELGVTMIIENITEKKHAEEEVRRYSEYLENIFAASPDSIIVSDLNGDIIECNQATLDILKYSSKKELIGKNGFELITKKDRNRAMENMKQVLKRGSIKNIKYTILTKDGYEFIVEFSASVIKDSLGNPTALVAVTKDISERKRIEEALKESEKKYRYLFENSIVGIGIGDINGNILEANKGMCRITGYPYNELLKVKLTDIYADPKDREELLRLIKKEGIIENFEVQLKNKNGDLYWTSISVRLIKYRGKDALLTTAIDITERRKAEEKIRILATIVNEAKVPIAMVNMKGIITTWNKSCEKVLGYSAKEMIEKIPMKEICPKADKQIQTTFKKGYCIDKELEYVAKDGRIIPLNTSTFLVKDKKGNPIGVSGIAIDVTAREKKKN